MNKSLPPVSYPWRLALVLGILTLFTLALLFRILNLTIFERAFLAKQGDARALRTISIPAHRGLVTDRNNHPLAISTPVFAVWINPHSFTPTFSQLNTLSEILQLKVTLVQTLKKNNANREFVYLKRHVLPEDADKIRAMHLSGIGLQEEYQRYYPEGEVTAQLVGFTNIDDHGIEGIELAFDHYLHGESGKKRVTRDLHGQVVSELDVIKPPTPGHSLRLSIDRRIQYAAYQELKEAIQKYQARAGSVVVLDSRSGEVLALVNQPSFNPNLIGKRDDLSFRNQAVTDLLEPGSTIKPFSILNGLMSGKFKPTDRFDTSPGILDIGSKKVRDIHDYGILDLSGILEHSSNVGVTKLTLALTDSGSLRRLLQQVGFGSQTQIEFPGESAGMLPERRSWPPFILATLSFGYGLATTTLQLAQGYMIFANHGQKVPITLLARKTPPIPRQIVPQVYSDQVLTMLENVVKLGGAKAASIPGYRVAGKTGTVRTLGNQGYDKHSHEALFVGIAPVSSPRLVIAVVIKEPKNFGYYGSQVAAPVFGHIAAASLRILDVPPDDLPTTTE